jgi:ribosomal protein S18 acetylase RimI-like enzyme
MKIEHCTNNHIEICASLLATVYAEPEFGEKWKDNDARDYLNRFYKIEPSGCFVAIKDGETIGAVFSYSYPWQAETLVYIQELFVSTKYRKLGVAKSLLKSIANGKTVKAWLVASDSTSASGFYKKMGFKKDGPYKFNYGVIST